MSKKIMNLIYIRMFVIYMISHIIFKGDSKNLLFIDSISLLLPVPFEVWYFIVRKKIVIDKEIVRKKIIRFCICFTIYCLSYYFLNKFSEVSIENFIEMSFFFSSSALVFSLYSIMSEKNVISINIRNEE